MNDILVHGICRVNRVTFLHGPSSALPNTMADFGAEIKMASVQNLKE